MQIARQTGAPAMARRRVGGEGRGDGDPWTDPKQGSEARALPLGKHPCRPRAWQSAWR